MSAIRDALRKTGEPVIEARNACVRHGHERSLDDVTFTIHAGEFVGIAGPNGGGKSTLLRAILGLVSLGRGEIRLFGAPRRELRPHARIGYVPQNASQVDVGFSATALEVVLLGRVGARGPLRWLGGQDKRLALEPMRPWACWTSHAGASAPSRAASVSACSWPRRSSRSRPALPRRAHHGCGSEGAGRVRAPPHAPQRHELTRLTARLEWTQDAPASGLDTFEVSIRHGRESDLSQGKAGYANATLQWRSIPYPSPTADGGLRLENATDTTSHGDWRIVVRLYGTGATPDAG